MFARGTWTKVSIEIDDSNLRLCANYCRWHQNIKFHCDLFNQDLHKEKMQVKFSRCAECLKGMTTNPYGGNDAAE